jgi:hypothetical protein
MRAIWSHPAARGLAVAALLLFPAAGTARAPKKKDFCASYIYVMNGVTLSDKVTLKLEYYTRRGGSWRWVKKTMTFKANQRAYVMIDGDKATARKVRGRYSYRKADKKTQNVDFKYDVNPGGKPSYKAARRSKFDLTLRDQIFERPR